LHTSNEMSHPAETNSARRDETSFDELLPEEENQLIEESVGKLRSATANAIFEALNEGKKFVLAYSGGIDSSIVEALTRQIQDRRAALTLGASRSSDLSFVSASKAEPSLTQNNAITVTEVKQPLIERAVKNVEQLVAVENLSQFEDCVSFWLIASSCASIPGVERILSANGPDELFCGYDRFRRIVDGMGYEQARLEIFSALTSAEKLSKQVKSVVSTFGFDIKEPLLNRGFREFALSIPIEYKILVGNDLLRKRIWRCLGKMIGLPQTIYMRPKKAMQYGMGVHSVVVRMLRNNRLRLEFLRA
jgi:asparagine synthase (glutamine-hydrolysing)